MKKRYAVMSFENEGIVSAVRSLGLEPISTAVYNGIKENPEASHADMQILKLSENEIFLLRGNTEFNERIMNITGSGCVTITDETIADFRYPGCVKLNTAVFGKKAIGNFSCTDKKVTERLITLGHELINVKQGYAKCSLCVVSENAVITSDTGIAKAAAAHGVDVLQISPGSIGLCERYGGFIGGSSFLLDKTLCFTGDITMHPDGNAINDFCKAHSVEAVSLTKEKLFDIGGVVII